MLTFSPDGSVTFAIDYDRFDAEDPARGHGRWRYRHVIAVDGETVADATDLRSGTTSQDRPEALAPMLATLLNFFSAYIEAINHEHRGNQASENQDLFPPACRPLAEALDAGQVALWAQEITGAD